MSEYTPTTDEVRAAWMTSGPPASTVVRAVEFERFLDQVRREAKAEALREAAEVLELPGSQAKGYYASESDAGYREAETDAGQWLNTRADQLEQEGKNDE